ncbi:MAG: hypothetical protein FJ088_12590, partial [Deltaproteobacteria bacterium]|nr:hypothetical protein [Deltaproteobacteria bacterium]
FFFILFRFVSRSGAGQQFIQNLEKNPAKLLALSFGAIILFGTLFLMFPRSTADRLGASFIDALFTATSATCVTGLTVLNTNADAAANLTLQSFSTFGQAIILILIQTGGLGIMTLSTAIVLLAGGRLSLRGKSMMQDVMDEEHVTSLKKIIQYIVISTFLIELIGSILLTLRFYYWFGDLGRSIYYGVFHSISAFCNAGFSLFSNSLEHFRYDLAINSVISILIVLGGLGFPVIASVFSLRHWGKGLSGGFKRFTPHVKIVLIVSAILIISGAVLIFTSEFSGTMREMPLPERLLSAVFQSVTARTAGFNTIDLSSIGRASIMIFCLLMFIGASPNSTGGGIKTTSAGLLVLTLRMLMRGDDEIRVYGRTIPRGIIYKVTAITFISLSLCMVVFTLLMLTQPALPASKLAFEVFSAFGTVGLSMGITQQLDEIGKILITMLMYIGRVGPLTMALALGERGEKAQIQYPEGKIIVG